MGSTNSKKYKEIDFSMAMTEYRSHTHAAHILFWSRDPRTGLTFALMQMRADGRFGFPGGKSDEPVVDRQEVITALYREIYEEMDYAVPEGQITLDDRLFTHIASNKGKVLHFFGKELPIDVFEGLELKYTKAKSFPCETVGLIRVPLSHSSPKGQTPVCLPVRNFFANFGRQVFAGNARNQFIESISRLKLMSKEDMQSILRNHLNDDFDGQ